MTRPDKAPRKIPNRAIPRWRGIELTDMGKRALLLDELQIDLPASWAAWGTLGSYYCGNGHRWSKPLVEGGAFCAWCEQWISG